MSLINDFYFEGYGEWLAISLDGYQNLDGYISALSDPLYKINEILQVTGVFRLDLKDAMHHHHTDGTPKPYLLYPSKHPHRAALPYQDEFFYDANPDCELGRKDFDAMVEEGCFVFKIDDTRPYILTPAKTAEIDDMGNIEIDQQTKLENINFPNKFSVSYGNKTFEVENGTYLSDDVRLILYGVKQWWSDAEEGNSKAQPTNKQVSDWFIKEGMSIRSANQAAVIIRPKWAAKGKKPK